jgi:hypothetical protein
LREIAFPVPGGAKSGERRNGGITMSSMEHHGDHHGYALSVPPEYAILVLVAVLTFGVLMSLPW